MLDVGEVYGRDSASSIIVGASYSSAACAWARWIGLDWTGLQGLVPFCMSKEGRKRRASSAHPYLGNSTWRYRYSLLLNLSSEHQHYSPHLRTCMCDMSCAVIPLQNRRRFLSSKSSCRCHRVAFVMSQPCSPTVLRHRRWLYLATTWSFCISFWHLSQACMLDVSDSGRRGVDRIP